MSRKERIEQMIRDRFQPIFLDLKDETDQHNVDPDGESHFKLILVSADFQNQPLLKRHRLVNALLADEFQQGLHALALHIYTPEEWQGQVPNSPPCLGGGR